MPAGHVRQSTCLPVSTLNPCEPAPSSMDADGMTEVTQGPKMETGCCIVGGGPAGMVLGFLLARSGVEVVVLEKHANFLRDFRGDTIHPSTLELMWELGILEQFLQRPHQKVCELA